MRSAVGVLAILVAVVVASIAPGRSAEVPSANLLIRVAIADRERDLPWLRELALDLAGVDWKGKTVDVVGDREVLDLLRARGFTAVIERDLDAAPLANPLAAYSDPAETNAALNALAAAYPTLAAKVTYATTEQGRPVSALKISDNVSAEEDEPAVFFIAQHHAREVMTPEIALDIATQLLSGYGVDPRVTAWVDAREIFILPSQNPDGTFFVFDRDKSWRKNRRDNFDNSFGVDLNRNYSFGWSSCGGSGGAGSDEAYRGPVPASEPETAGITLLAHQQRPVISLSYHTYGEQVLIPYGCAGVHAAEKAVFRRLSSDIAASLVSDNGAHWYQPGAPWEILYPEDGETNAWFYGDNGTYALEIEVNSSSQGFLPNYGSWRDSTVTRSRPGWQYVLDRIDGPGISGHVTDACNGSPLAAYTALDDLVFAHGESPRVSDPTFGRFQWLTNPGELHLRAWAGSYAQQVWPVTVGLTRADRPIRLVPAGARAAAASQIVVQDAAGDADGEADPGESAVVFVHAMNTSAQTIDGLTATLTTADPYVTIVDGASAYGSPTTGASATGDGFAIAILPGAPDGHVAGLHVHWSATLPLCAADEDVTLRITTGRPGCAVVESLDANPGWTIQNSTTGGWAFGPPAGDNGPNGPAAAYSGTSVYGTNLAGLYGSNADYRLSTASYDLGKLRHAVVSYRRWLDNEPGIDRASVELSNDGGATWLPVDAGFGYGDGWEALSHDVASTADGRPDVRFRFRLTSDGFDARSGFYVDDFRICGEVLTRRPNGVGATVLVSRSAGDLRLDWLAPPGDAAHDPATGYRVYRSNDPGAGFTTAAASTVPFAVLPGEAASPANGYFLVVAENPGGTSADAPAP